MRILVTGAAGFIGSHLSESLAAASHDVVGLDCFSDYYSRRLKELNAQDLADKKIPILPLDLASDDLSEAVNGVEVVYHAAAQPGISDKTTFETYMRNNLTATWRLLEAAKTQPSLKCFINVSTSSVYGAHATDTEETPPKPTSYYGVTKLAAEQLALSYCRDKGLPTCSLRLFSVYGERERPDKLYHKLIRCILEGQAFPLHEGSLEHRRSFTYVGDIIAGFLSVLTHLDACFGETFNIGTDIEITTGEGIRIVEEIIGQKARIEPRPRRPGDQLRTHANIEKARRILGYAPKTTPQEGIRAEVEWYKTRILGKVSL